MSGTGILPRSAIAATNLNNKIRVYFQAYNGYLRESKTDNGVDWTTLPNAIPTESKPRTFTPIAATSYDSLGELRIYYATVDNYLEEVCWSDSRGQWYPGELNRLKVQIASYSQLAVVHWGHDFRIYYQRASDNKILELSKSGDQPWVHDSTIRTALAGSKISAVHDDSTNIIRVYYQGVDNLTYEVTSSNGWANENIIRPAVSPPQGAYAAILFGTDLRLYFTTNANYLAEGSGSTSATSWSGPRDLRNTIALTNIAAVSWGNITAIRVYSQDEGNRIIEQRWGEGADWRQGAVVPTN